jgi:hypothetical protein
VIPVAVAIAALFQFRHFYSVRYVAAGLLGYAVLVGAGIAAIARLTQRAQWIAAAILIGLIAWKTVPASRAEPFQKLDWRLIASTIWSHAHEDDRVFTAESWSTVSLRFYLDRLPERVRMAQVFPVEIADLIAANERPIWIVSAGYLSDVAVRNWACRFPVLLASSLELFRLHYAPTVEHFLEERSTPIEQRAWAAGGSQTRTLRLAEWELAATAPYLDQNTAWRMTKSEQLPAARLGFDPATALARVKSGAIDVEDLAEWIAPASQCLDDEAFLRRAYEVLLRRPPAPIEHQQLAALLRAGKTRLEVVRRIVRTDELQARLSAKR